MRAKLHWSMRFCAGVLMLGGAPAAYAQQPPPEPTTRSHQNSRPRNSGTIEDIVVTSQKRAQRLQNVPLSVSAFSAKEVARSGITNATSLAQHVPALFVALGGGGTVLPFLRGVGNQDSIVGNESSVAIYLDDVYISRLDSSFLELSDISRIEVLKGPQGTLFGRNASAGVINIFTKEPSKSFEANASVGYGNYNTTTEKLYLSGPILPFVEGNVSVLHSRQGEGWGRDITTGEPVGYDDPFLIKSKLQFQLTPTTTLRLAGDYSESSGDIGIYTNNIQGTTLGKPDFYSLPPYNQPPQRVTPAPGFYDSINDYPNTNHLRGFGMSAKLGQDLGFGQFTSITGFRQIKQDFHVDGDYTQYDGLGYQLASQTRTFTQEMQLASKPGSSFDWIVGLFYLNEFSAYQPVQITGLGLATDVLGGGFGPVLPPGSTVDLFAQERVKDYAGYTQVTVHLPYHTNLTGGFRYTVDDIGGYGSTGITLPGVTALNIPGPKDAVEFRKPTFKIGLDHHFTTDILGYVSFSRGFKAGTYNLLPFSAPATKPEVLDSYEIGAKTTLLNHKLLLNGAFFYYKYTDPQVQEVQNHLIFLANAGAATVKGVDLDAQYVFSPNLSVHGGGEFLDAHYTDFPDAPFYSSNYNPPYGALQTAANVDGNLLPESSKFAFNVGGNYNFEFPFGRFDFNTNYAFTGSLRFTPDNVIRQGSFGLLDASLEYQLPNSDHWALKAYGRNITGKHYYIGAQENSGAAGFVYAPGFPAIYGVTLTYSY